MTAAPLPQRGEGTAAAEDLTAIEAALAEDNAEVEAAPARARAGSAPGGAGPLSHGSNPELTLIADFALAAFSTEEHHQTGAHDPRENGFNLQQLELSFGSAVDPYFRFDANLVFALEGVELEEAYATTLDLPLRLQARAGQFLTRFGRANATHPHTWNFVDQPFWLGRVFGGEGNRGLGLELSYLTPLPWYVELVVSVTGANGEGSARSFYGPSSTPVESPLDLLYVAALKQFFPLSTAWSLAIGASSAFGPNGTGRDNRSEVYGADLYLKYRSPGDPEAPELAFQAEWLYRRRQLPEDVLQDAGGYLELVARFARRYAVGARYELGTPSYGASGRVASDPLDPEWSSVRVRSSLALTYQPTEFSRLRLQGSRDAGWFGERWAAFLAAEFVIGAHGPHGF